MQGNETAIFISNFPLLVWLPSCHNYSIKILTFHPCLSFISSDSNLSISVMPPVRR